MTWFQRKWDPGERALHPRFWGGGNPRIHSRQITFTSQQCIEDQQPFEALSKTAGAQVIAAAQVRFPTPQLPDAAFSIEGRSAPQDQHGGNPHQDRSPFFGMVASKAGDSGALSPAVNASGAHQDRLFTASDALGLNASKFGRIRPEAEERNAGISAGDWQASRFGHPAWSAPLRKDIPRDRQCRWLPTRMIQEYP